MNIFIKIFTAIYFSSASYAQLASYLNPENELLLANLTAPQIDIARQINATARQGVATVSNNRNIGDGASMACGLSYLSPHFTKFFIGTSTTLFSKGKSCSYCVRLYCIDTICQDPFLNDATFMITDKCDACKGNDIIISAQGMKNISGVNIDINPSIQVAFIPTSCAEFIQGGIKMVTADELSTKYIALNFSNLKEPLESVGLNGLQLFLDPLRYGYWVIDQRKSNQDINLRPPYALELIGVHGQRLSVRIVSLVSQDLDVNFSN